ncbi:MAG: hypothetical protein K6E29_03220 [Cyanobacteria bacterium RUI128]|nr:hypothetical protein [Cyanobacteria bacterium RUI128]
MMTSQIPVFAGTYDFSDEAQAEFERHEALEKARVQNEDAKAIKKDPQLQKAKKKEVQPQTYQQQDLYEPMPKTMSGTVMVIPKGEVFEAVLQSSISSESLANDDVIAATLNADWYYNGILVAPQGSVVYGHATDIKKAGYAYANGQLAMTFDEILTPAGDRIRLTSNKVYIEIKDKRALKIAGNVAIGALGGLVTGVLYSLITGGDVAGGLAIGSAVGAAGGMVSAVAHKGENAEVPAGTVIIVRLVQPTEIVPYR